MDNSPLTAAEARNKIRELTEELARTPRSAIRQMSSDQLLEFLKVLNELILACDQAIDRLRARMAS